VVELLAASMLTHGGERRGSGAGLSAHMREEEGA
jgi:hypothetical protein